MSFSWFSRAAVIGLALGTGASTGCSPAPSEPAPSTGGSGGGAAGAGGTGGGQRTGGTPAGGAGGTGGTAGSGGAGQGGSGGGSGGTSGEGGASAGSDAAADSSAPGALDALPDASGSPDGGKPSYEGELPLYQGPPVGPEVAMACPGDPTMGFTEYQDTFHVEHPWDLPINTRFKIEDGVYHYWVQRNDKPLNRTTKALNPRTEARYSQNFTSGIRMWSGDVYLEKDTNGSVIMQVHTTTTGIGPVYLHVEGNSRLEGSSIKSSDIPGGLFDNWFNMKVQINGATTESQIWINNCLKTTQRGVRGNGINYFKNGIYHCEENAVCHTRFKNVKLYQKL